MIIEFSTSVWPSLVPWELSQLSLSSLVEAGFACAEVWCSSVLFYLSTPTAVDFVSCVISWTLAARRDSIACDSLVKCLVWQALSDSFCWSICMINLAIRLSTPKITPVNSFIQLLAAPPPFILHISPDDCPPTSLSMVMSLSVWCSSPEKVSVSRNSREFNLCMKSLTKPSAIFSN